ncbi:MAG: hypothetical protein IPI04_07865 [Ignavibacteria bacterium]|nr:hypothetical protein [Ignavibacteria bacterium]
MFAQDGLALEVNSSNKTFLLNPGSIIEYWFKVSFDLTESVFTEVYALK